MTESVSSRAYSNIEIAPGASPIPPELEYPVHHFNNLLQMAAPSWHENEPEGRVEYVETFARELGFEVTKDQHGNLLCRKPADKGFEDRDIVVAQGHLDHVVDGEANREGPTHARIEADDTMWSKDRDTTLGADNGAGVGIMLGEMEKVAPTSKGEDDEGTGERWFVFTVAEELGLQGAIQMDPKIVPRRQVDDDRKIKMLNLDSEKEGEICNGCAGASVLRGKFETTLREHEVAADQTVLAIDLSGLPGGHSGVQIHEKLGSAFSLLGAVLDIVQQEDADYMLCPPTAGHARNSISKAGKCEVVVSSEKEARIKERVAALVERIRTEGSEELGITAENATQDGGLQISCEATGAKSANVLSQTERDGFANVLRSSELHGVFKTVPGREDMPLSSSNFSTMTVTVDKDDARKVQFDFEVLMRANDDEDLDGQLAEGKAVFEAAGIEASEPKEDRYPGCYIGDSPLVQLAQETGAEIHGANLLEPEPVHAGLEMGVLKGLFESLGWEVDTVSISIHIEKAHSNNEHMDVRDWEKTVRWSRDMINRI